MVRIRLHRRALTLLILLCTALYLSVGAAPVYAGPTDVPPGWNAPLPGYGVDDTLPPGDTWPAFTYTSSPFLRKWADLPPPTEEELLDVGARKSYAYGTAMFLFAEWKEKYAAAYATKTPAERQKKWTTFVRKHVGGVDSNDRGNSYSDWVWPEYGIAAPQYEFDKQVDPSIPVRPDARALTAGVNRVHEIKDTRQLGEDARKQLDGYVQLVDAKGEQVVYSFRVKPRSGVLKLIAEKNAATAINKARAAAGLPLAPAIVARLKPATPAPVSRADPDHLQMLAARGVTPSPGEPMPSPTGNGPVAAKTGPGTGPKGAGGGVLVAPGATQYPIDGALADAVEDSAEDAEDAAFGKQVTQSLAADLGNEDLSGDQLGGVDFSTLELRYVSDTYQGGPGLGYAFSATPTAEGTPSYGGRRAALLASDAFFVWMALPTRAFTVNLNPDEPDRIIDARFGRTDAGRVLLEADLQMKKSVGKLIDPATATGKPFWAGLAGEKCVQMRQWIVPGPAVVREDAGQLYILDAPLQVKMEGDVVKSVGVGGGEAGCPGQSDADSKRNESLFRTLILPLVVKAVNTAPEYADLRRVYLSRVAAQWYRERSETKRTAYSDLIDQGNADAWAAREPWDPKEVWQRYVKAYTDGEFKFEERVDRGDVIEIYTYVYGGVDLTNIPRSKLSADALTRQRPALAAVAAQAVYAPTAEDGQPLVWLGGRSTARPLPDLQKSTLGSPTSAPTFWMLTMLPVLLWTLGGAILLVRRRRGTS